MQVGSKGQAVVEWQSFLKEQGFFTAGLAPIFGPKTYAATKDFQAANNLAPDGIVGPKTRAVADKLRKPAKGLSDTDIARRAGIPAQVLKAIRYVESRGRANADRFEPHLFLRKRPDLQDDVPYTRSNRGYSLVKGETGRKALAHAATFDIETAIRSTSFGRYQVLGGYLLAAYPGPAEDALAAFWANPVEASDLMVAAWFKDNATARRAANAKPPDFAALARAYNGPNYKVHHYDTRLETAWKDSPWKS